MSAGRRNAAMAHKILIGLGCPALADHTPEAGLSPHVPTPDPPPEARVTAPPAARLRSEPNPTDQRAREIAQIEDAVRRGEVKQCPPAYVAEVNNGRGGTRLVVPVYDAQDGRGHRALNKRLWGAFTNAAKRAARIRWGAK